jgi:hypothetical protein
MLVVLPDHRLVVTEVFAVHPDVNSFASSFSGQHMRQVQQLLHKILQSLGKYSGSGQLPGCSFALRGVLGYG